MVNHDDQRVGAAGGRLVTACIPYFRCARYIGRAVESLLAQTHRNLCVVVINDGDPDPPWKQLSHIRDPRLVCFSLARNHGPYFAMSVVLNVTAAPYFLMQDADDWSPPTRVQLLLSALERERSDLAVSAQLQYVERSGKCWLAGVRWDRRSVSSRRRERFAIKTSLTPEHEYRAPHAGLFRTSLLRELGGYYAGFRVGYDSLLTNLVLMTGRLSYVPLPLYCRLLRSDSLTHSSNTGFNSEFAKRVNAEIGSLYRSCYAWYSQFRLGRVNATQLKQAIRAICVSRISIADQQHLLRETRRLAVLQRNLRARFAQNAF